MIFKIATTIVAGIALTAAASAEPTRGRERYNFDTGKNDRIGTYCRLTVRDRDVHDGLCNISRDGDTTTVTAGRRSYTIERDYDDAPRARFYREGDLLDAEVYSSGSCWEGSKVKFCAR